MMLRGFGVYIISAACATRTDVGQFSLAFERGVCSCPGSATDASGFSGIDYFSSVCNADRCGTVFPRF